MALLAVKYVIFGIERAILGKVPLSHVYWFWFIFFSLLEYVAYGMRQQIASTQGGAIFGLVILWLLIFAKPFWILCVWLNARNVVRKVWSVLAVASTLIIGYYTYDRASFLILLLRNG